MAQPGWRRPEPVVVYRLSQEESAKVGYPIEKKFVLAVASSALFDLSISRVHQPKIFENIAAQNVVHPAEIKKSAYSEQLLPHSHILHTVRYMKATLSIEGSVMQSVYAAFSNATVYVRVTPTFTASRSWSPSIR